MKLKWIKCKKPYCDESIPEGNNYCSVSCWSFCEQYDNNRVQFAEKEKYMSNEKSRVPGFTEFWCDQCGEIGDIGEGIKDYHLDTSYCSAQCMHQYEIDEKAKSPSNVQEGGNHYKNYAIEPIDFVHVNALSYIQGNVIKYIVRYKDKNGLEDLKKAKHYIDLLIERDYNG